METPGSENNTNRHHTWKPQILLITLENPKF